MEKKLSITKHPDDKEIVIYPDGLGGSFHATLFWLHRAGECSETYDQVFLHGDVPSRHGIKVRILEAPVRKITFMQYREESAWFNIEAIYDQDILSKNESQIFDFGHIQQCVTIINKEVEEEVELMRQRGIKNPYMKIFIGGIGQGATMAIHYAMTSKLALGGVIAVGGYYLKSTPQRHLNYTKLLFLNGKNDKLIPQKVSKQSYERVMTSYNTTYQSIEGEGDQFTPAYLHEINKFLLANIHN